MKKSSDNILWWVKGKRDFFLFVKRKRMLNLWTFKKGDLFNLAGLHISGPMQNLSDNFNMS